MNNAALIVSYGGGLNSAAVLVALKLADEIPHAIVFCDTGGERPSTYESVTVVSSIVQAWGFPPILTIKREGETLEENCLRGERLPSVAYGFKSCSVKWKQDPFVKWFKAWRKSNMFDSYTVCFGFDADEERRVRQPDPKNGYLNRFPLIEAGWDRNECKSKCADVLGHVPKKSACFFCPNSKRREVLELKKLYPELMERALFMEDNAKETNITLRGLGRNVSWRDILERDAQPKLFDQPCMCSI